MHGKFQFMGNEQFRNSSFFDFFSSLLSGGCMNRKKGRKINIMYYEINVNYHIIFSYHYYELLGILLIAVIHQPHTTHAIYK